ncbi:DUF1648 domain-containing protein [Alkaliphilus serpentinus]|uniref:DUF1648 domain-containing protein n=1 Tax=Alkaliphilus serpentinus TaxID=1482731 RepID=A0A833MDE3_9FIRM|nr:DUF5808 domain-containing protein [Alkaliphilus serpentinus]KAB3528831.1 DUF1648 domain-containing protein [Alkaliphilus serpentinus]
MFTFTLWLNLFTIYIPFLIFGLLLPNYIRKTLLFGVNIPEEVLKDEKVLILKKEYRRNYLVSFCIIVGLIIFFAFRGNDIRLLNMGITIAIMVLPINYIFIHLKTKKLKAAEGWLINRKQVVMISTSRGSANKMPSMKWFLIPAVITIFTWLFTMIMYPHLPHRIPMKFDITGKVIEYGNKGFSSAFGMPLSQLAMVLMFYYISIVIGRSKMTLNPSKPKTSVEQYLTANRRWVAFTIFTATIICLYFAYQQLMIIEIIKTSGVFNMVANIVLIAAPILTLIILAISTGQSGSKITVSTNEERDEKLVNRDDDQFWKLGIFYFNPQDPSLWIEKRFGIGWTVNFGNPIGVILGIITIIVLGWSIYSTTK